jgi:hypothetical protein
MDRAVREKKATKPLNYATMGGKNPAPPVSAPKKRVLDRYHYEAVDDEGGSASFPSTQPPPIGPFQRDKNLRTNNEKTKQYNAEYYLNKKNKLIELEELKKSLSIAKI